MDIIQNIQGIIAIALVLILNAITIAKGVTAIIKSVKDAKNASAEEKQAAKEAIVQNLQQAIFGWVTDAEQNLGGGTGKLKSSKVAAKIYENIPDDLKPLFTPQEIQDMIDTVLKDAKKYWEKNDKAREYIESGTQAVLTAEAEAVKAADGLSVEDVAKAVGAGVSAAIKMAVETTPTAAPESPVETREPQEG